MLEWQYSRYVENIEKSKTVFSRWPNQDGGRHVGCSWTTMIETGVSKNISGVVQSKKPVSRFYPSPTPLLAPSWSFFLFLLLLLLSMLLLFADCCSFLVSLQICFLRRAFHRFSWFSNFSFRLSKVSSCPYFPPCINLTKFYMLWYFTNLNFCWNKGILMRVMLFIIFFVPYRCCMVCGNKCWSKSLHIFEYIWYIPWQTIPT